MDKLMNAKGVRIELMTIFYKNNFTNLNIIEQTKQLIITQGGAVI